MRKIRENDYHCILSAFVLSLENKDTQRFTENIFYRFYCYIRISPLCEIYEATEYSQRKKEKKRMSQIVLYSVQLNA